jgi:predicted nucleic acid-binding protein
VTAPLFVDTSALYAVYGPADERHAEANRLLAAARASRRPLISSTDVFNELMALLSCRVAPDATVRIGEELRREDLFRLVRVDDEIRNRAWAIFVERRLPKLSFTDCTSSAILTMCRIREVFTFDEDFRRLGHRTQPPPRPLLKPRPPASPLRRDRERR